MVAKKKFVPKRIGEYKVRFTAKSIDGKHRVMRDYTTMSTSEAALRNGIRKQWVCSKPRILEISKIAEYRQKNNDIYYKVKGGK